MDKKKIRSNNLEFTVVYKIHTIICSYLRFILLDIRKSIDYKNNKIYTYYFTIWSGRQAHSVKIVIKILWSIKNIYRRRESLCRFEQWFSHTYALFRHFILTLIQYKGLGFSENVANSQVQTLPLNCRYNWQVSERGVPSNIIRREFSIGNFGLMFIVITERGPKVK